MYVMNNKYTIAAFDFDDTITKKCTFVDIIIHVKGYTNFLLGMAILLPDVILYKLGLMSNYLVKKKMFTRFFAGVNKQDYYSFCEDYSLNKIDPILHEKAKEKIAWHKEQGHKLLIITASMEEWVKPWALINGFEDVISTKPEIIDDKLTGDFQTKNCFGKEKVNRLREKYPNREEYYLYAYGDSEGDKDLLQYADIPSYNYIEGCTG